MRTFTALLSYDDPAVEDVLVALPHVVETKRAAAPAGTVDVFELVDGEPLSPFALYEFRHTRTAHLGAEGIA